METFKESKKDFLWIHLRDLPYFRALIRSIESNFFQQFDLPEPILDIGCGDGHFAKLTFNKTLDVGIDPWIGPLRKAVKRKGVYKFLIQGDAGKMPFPDNYFSSAFSNSVLEHIPHVDEVLLETARVMKKDSIFLFSVPNPRYFSELHISALLEKIGFYQFGQWYKAWFRLISRVYHADFPEIWQHRLEMAGFRLERWWHYFSPRALRKLEWGHYFGFPSLFIHLFTRRWLLVPTRWNLILTERFIRPHSKAVSHPNGAFTFFVARRIDS